jgi:hypothetical protein
MEVGYLENPGEVRLQYPVRDIILGGWDAPFLKAGSARGWVVEDSTPAAFRTLAEGTVGESWRGFTRVGLDFWEVDLPGGTKRRVLGRYHPWINLMRDNPRAITAPGPEGALPTVRYQMLREGIQECEARIYIERALSDEETKARLSPDLIARCEDLLRGRIHARMFGLLAWEWYIGSDWQSSAEDLYRLAWEVQMALVAGQELR